jgi:hypothetical protein
MQTEGVVATNDALRPRVILGSMAQTYAYRFIRFSWGIAIDITAEALPVRDYTGAPVAVARDLWLAYDAPPRLSFEEHAYLASGLRMVAPTLRRQTSVALPLVVRVVDLMLALTDYQPEGLAAALAGWVAQRFDAPAPTIMTTFDRGRNRYIYQFPPIEEDEGVR